MIRIELAAALAIAAIVVGISLVAGQLSPGPSPSLALSLDEMCMSNVSSVMSDRIDTYKLESIAHRDWYRSYTVCLAQKREAEANADLEMPMPAARTTYPKECDRILASSEPEISAFDYEEVSIAEYEAEKACREIYETGNTIESITSRLRDSVTTDAEVGE